MEPVGHRIRCHVIHNISLLARQYHRMSPGFVPILYAPLTNIRKGRRYPALHPRRLRPSRAPPLDRRRLRPRFHVRPPLGQNLRHLQHPLGLPLQHLPLRSRQRRLRRLAQHTRPDHRACDCRRGRLEYVFGYYDICFSHDDDEGATDVYVQECGFVGDWKRAGSSGISCSCFSCLLGGRREGNEE